jgi:hypothetical protein
MINKFSTHNMIAGEIQGAYQIKVTTSALALLINSKHSELEKVQVQGHLIKVCCDIIYIAHIFLV